MKKSMLILIASFLLYGVQLEAKLSAKEESELRKAMIDYKKATDSKKRAAFQKTIDKYAQKYPNDPLVKAKLNEKARFDQGMQKPNAPAIKPQPVKQQPVKPAAKPMPVKPQPIKPVPAKPQPVQPVNPPALPPRPLEAFVPVSAESLINKSAAEQDAVFAAIMREPSITRDMRIDYYDKYIAARVNQFAHEVKNAHVQLLFDNNGNITREFQVFIPRLKNIIVHAEDVKHKLGVEYEQGGQWQWDQAKNVIDVPRVVFKNPILLNLAKNTQGRYVDSRGEMDYFEVFVLDLQKMIDGNKNVLKYNI